MALVPSINNVQREINRMFDSMLSRTGDYEGDVLCDWAPRVDIVERENEFVITSDLPGITRDQINVNVEKNMLTISGERRRTEPKEGERWYRAERNTGTFKRTFSLPNTIDAGGVSADYRDGVLTVTLPKAEEAKPRQIQINVS